MIDQDVTHDIGGETQHAAAILPHRIGAINETQVRFVYKCGGLKGMVLALEAHFACCQPM